MNRYLFFILLLLHFFSCQSQSEKNARELLDQAEKAYQTGQLELSLSLLDSLHSSQPEALRQRRKAIALQQVVRLQLSRRDSAYAAPHLTELTELRDSLLQYFYTDRDTRFEDEHIVRYKGSTPQSFPYLDAYLNKENTPEVVVSTRTPQPLKALHLQIEDLTEGTYIQSDTLSYDEGACYRYQVGSLYYERLTFTHDNALALIQFVALADPSHRLRATVGGANELSFPLSPTCRISLRALYQLTHVQDDIKQMETTLQRHMKRLKQSY